MFSPKCAPNDPLGVPDTLASVVGLVKLVQRRVVPEEVVAGTEIPGGGGGGSLCLTLHCHHKDDCIKMGSDESNFNVSLIVRDKVTRQCPHATTSKERGEPKRNRTEVPLATSLTPCARLNWLTWMNVPLNVQPPRES